MTTKLKLQTDSAPSKFNSPEKNKYKSFLTSVLTPRSRKWIKRKKSIHSEYSFTLNPNEDTQRSDDSHTPGYASIQDFQLTPSHDQESKCSIENAVSVGKPLYASVDKKKKKPRDFEALTRPDEKSTVSEEQYQQRVCNQKVVNKHQFTKTGNNEKEILSQMNTIEEQKEEIHLLVERLKELTTENRKLHLNIETVMKEQKWKEESLHANLNLKISQLEADTHKEVKCLTDQILILQEEKKVLADQIEVMHEKKKQLQVDYDTICKKAKMLLSPEILKKNVDDHEKLLTSLKKEHLKDIEKLQKENEIVQTSKIVLVGQVKELEKKVQALMLEKEHLRNSNVVLVGEKSKLMLQLEESRLLQEEHQCMILALLKMTETVTEERDILLSKASYQDEQHHLLKTSIMEYTLNMGRLQEHISNLSKEKLEELQRLKKSATATDESIKHIYGKHFELLRNKLLNQKNVINDLQAEKSQLEKQLESMWQVACLPWKK